MTERLHLNSVHITHGEIPEKMTDDEGKVWDILEGRSPIYSDRTSFLRLLVRTDEYGNYQHKFLSESTILEQVNKNGKDSGDTG